MRPGSRVGRGIDETGRLTRSRPKRLSKASRAHALHVIHSDSSRCPVLLDQCGFLRRRSGRIAILIQNQIITDDGLRISFVERLLFPFFTSTLACANTVLALVRCVEMSVLPPLRYVTLTVTVFFGVSFPSSSVSAVASSAGLVSSAGAAPGPLSLRGCRCPRKPKATSPAH